MSFLYALGSVLVISLASLAGAAGLSLSNRLLRRALILLVSFAAGALLGDVFFHLLPELVEEHGFELSISVGVLVGILFSFILEKFIHWHHCHLPEDHCHDEHEHAGHTHAHPVGYLTLFGDGVHNFVDGLIIGASYLVDVNVGIATTIAVLLHELPQELGDFGLLLHAGFSRARALAYNFISALAAVLGVAVAYLSSNIEMLHHLLIPFAAGNFIYIALADIVPELHREQRWPVSLVQLLFFVLGMAFMAALLLLETAH